MWLGKSEVDKIFPDIQVERYNSTRNIMPPPSPVHVLDSLYGAKTDEEPAELEKKLLETVASNPSMLDDISGVEFFYSDDPEREINFFMHVVPRSKNSIIDPAVSCDLTGELLELADLDEIEGVYHVMYAADGMCDSDKWGFASHRATFKSPFPMYLVRGNELIGHELFDKKKGLFKHKLSLKDVYYNDLVIDHVYSVPFTEDPYKKIMFELRVEGEKNLVDNVMISGSGRLSTQRRIDQLKFFYKNAYLERAKEIVQSFRE